MKRRKRETQIRDISANTTTNRSNLLIMSIVYSSQKKRIGLMSFSHRQIFFLQRLEIHFLPALRKKNSMYWAQTEFQNFYMNKWNALRKWDYFHFPSSHLQCVFKTQAAQAQRLKFQVLFRCCTAIHLFSLL